MAKCLSRVVILISVLLIISCGQAPHLKQQASQSPEPKHIILMISDGIGFNGWLAADYYQGLAGKQSYQITRPDGTKPVILGLAHSALNLIDSKGNVLPKGTDASLAAGATEQGYDPSTRWDKFENSMANDFSPVSQSYTSYTDSAAAGTALMTGRKTAVERIGMDWTGTRKFASIASIAMDHGLSAGTVTTVPISHATPAAAIAHNPSRHNYADIFNEMFSSNLSVIMGGGHPDYDDNGYSVDPNTDKDYKYVGGEETYASLSTTRSQNDLVFIDNKLDFEKLASGENIPQRVVGIARTGSTLQASRTATLEADTPSGVALNSAVPDLATMTKGALNVLSQDQDGFFVMIEGGAVDWMGHANNMPRFIEEQIDFNKAVNTVIQWVEQNSSWDETLLIITSDHECGGVWGEGTWTNSVGGAVAAERSDEALLAARFNPSEDQFNDFLAVQDKGAGNMPGYQWASRYHTNELVPLWAIGAGSQRFAEFTRTDLKAASLWGKKYGWNGNFVDNTVVFEVMKAGISPK